jgi:transcriptional regulator with XRE-family HTH domain
MSIPEALRVSSDEAGWSPAKIASVCGVSETTSRRWLRGDAVPPGDKLLLLQRDLPGFATRVTADAEVRRAS